MKRRSAVTVGMLLLASALIAQPAQQEPGAGQPAQPRSPEVLADGRVVFRLLAPDRRLGDARRGLPDRDERRR